MLSGWDMLKLRLRYGNLDEEDFHDLLRDALHGMREGDTRALRRVTLDAGLEIRPRCNGSAACAPDDMQWKYWTAMALRYFPELSAHRPAGAKQGTLADVRDWIEHDRELVQALLFGDLLLIDLVLTEGFDSQKWRSSLPRTSSEQEVVLDIIRYHVHTKDISERQVGNWTNEPIPAWAVRLRHRLQVDVLRGLTATTEHFVYRFSGTDHPTDPAMFRDYMTRFRDAGLDWAYGQALGYHNELKRRFRRAGQSAPWVVSGSILTLTLPISLILARDSRVSPIIPLTLIGVTLLGFLLVAVNIVRIGTTLLGLTGIIEAQVQTLEEIASLYLPDDSDL